MLENRREDGRMEFGKNNEEIGNNFENDVTTEQVSNYFEKRSDDYMVDQFGNKYPYNAETDSYESQIYSPTLEDLLQSDANGVCVNASDGASFISDDGGYVSVSDGSNVVSCQGGLVKNYHSFRKSDLNKTISIRTTAEKIKTKERNKFYNNFLSEEEKDVISETTFGIIVGMLSTLFVLGIISLISKSFANGITSFFEPKLIKWIVDSISNLF